MDDQETKNYLATDYSEGLFQKPIWRHYFDKFLRRNFVQNLKDYKPLIDLHQGLETAEIVGFCFSIIALALAAILLFYLSRVRQRISFLIHGQLVVALLFMYLVQVILYGDMKGYEGITHKLDEQFVKHEVSEFSMEWNPNVELSTLDARIEEAQKGRHATIARVQSALHHTKGLCELFYFLYEFGKTAAFFWVTVEGAHLLYKTGALTSWAPKQKILHWSIFAWTGAAVTTLIWLVITVGGTSWMWKNCLGIYMTYRVFWVLEGIRVILLLINTGIVVHTVIVLLNNYIGIPEQNKLYIWFQLWLVSVLVLLFGIPLILRHIRFDPTQNPFGEFKFYAYTVLIFHIFLGFLVAVVSCFANPSVWREFLSWTDSTYQYDQASQSDGTEKTWVYSKGYASRQSSMS